MRTRTENFRQFREGLRELGYVEGKSIVIEWRLSNNYEIYPGLALDHVNDVGPRDVAVW